MSDTFLLTIGNTRKMDFDTHQTLYAIIAGGFLNTTVLAWVGATVLRMDRDLTRLNVHMAYLRREVAYQSGREWEVEKDTKE